MSEVKLMNLSMMNGYMAKIDGIETERATIQNTKRLEPWVSKNAARSPSERVSHYETHDRSAGSISGKSSG